MAPGRAGACGSRRRRTRTAPPRSAEPPSPVHRRGPRSSRFDGRSRIAALKAPLGDQINLPGTNIRSGQPIAWYPPPGGAQARTRANRGRPTGPTEVSDTCGADTSPVVSSGLAAAQRVGGRQRAANLLVEVDGALHRLLPVAEVEALVLRVGVGVRVLDADEQRRHAAELAGERLDERDAAAAADGHRVRAVALLQRPERRLERRVARVRVPPARRVVRRGPSPRGPTAPPSSARRSAAAARPADPGSAPAARRPAPRPTRR